MGENLLESYNPLYDVHLRQYFALPHMQKHLRNLGLLDGSPVQQQNELHVGHLAMMDLMLRNRERVLQQLMDLQRKLDAAEKVELYRRIRSGITNADEADKHQHMSRSLSRPARSAVARLGEFRGRRQSMSPEASELIKRVESDYRSDSAPFKNPKSIYNRLAASVYKYQYLHKLDDRTLRKYMLSLRKQLAKLERFREVSFGPHTMAKHQPQQLQQSWFFRRRSLPSLNSANANQSRTHTQQTNAGGQRSLKSGLSHKTRSGKSQSPLKFVNAIEEPPNKMQRRTSTSRTRQRLPPLPKKRSFAASRTNTLPTSKTVERLPPTAATKPSRNTPPEPRHARPPSTAQKKTPTGSRPASKGSNTPVLVQKRTSASSAGGILPAIGGAIATAGAVQLLSEGEGKKAEEEEPEGRESAAPSPSISLAASQTTTTDGGQPGADSEWEEQRKGSAKSEAAPEGFNGGTETRPTPELLLEQKNDNEEKKDDESDVSKETEEEEEEQQQKTPEPAEEEDDKMEEQRTNAFQRENAPSPEERHEAEELKSPMEENAFVGQTQEQPTQEREEATESISHQEERFAETEAKSPEGFEDESKSETEAKSPERFEDESKSPEEFEDETQSINHHEDHAETLEAKSPERFEDESKSEIEAKSPERFEDESKSPEEFEDETQSINHHEDHAETLEAKSLEEFNADTRSLGHHEEHAEKADAKSPEEFENEARSLSHHEEHNEKAETKSFEEFEEEIRSLDHTEYGKGEAKSPEEFEVDARPLSYHEEHNEAGVKSPQSQKEFEAEVLSFNHQKEHVEETDFKVDEEFEEETRSLDHKEEHIEDESQKEFETEAQSFGQQREDVEEANSKTYEEFEDDDKSLENVKSNESQKEFEDDAQSPDHHEEHTVEIKGNAEEESCLIDHSGQGFEGFTHKDDEPINLANYDQSDFLIENRSVGEEENQFIREGFEYNNDKNKGGEPLDECPSEGCRLIRDDLVESEDVLKDEDGLERKLSKTGDFKAENNWEDTNGSEDIAQKHLLKEEDEEALFEKEEGKVDLNGERRHSQLADSESLNSWKKQEEEEEEGTLNYYGKPTWKPMEETNDGEGGERGKSAEEEQSQHEQSALRDDAVLGQQINFEWKDETAKDEIEHQSDHHHQSPAENGISLRQSDDGTRPATAESIHQTSDEPIIEGINRLTTRPSIQITSASEYGGSVEGNLDSPKTQLLNKALGEESQVEEGNGEEEKAKRIQMEEEMDFAAATEESEGINGGEKADQTELGRKSNGHIHPAEKGALSDESEGSDGENDGSVIIQSQKPKTNEEQQKMLELETNSEGGK